MFIKRFITIAIFTVISISAYPQTHTNTVIVDRGSENLFKLEDMFGVYSGFWTMNDGLGNMAIKLGINGDGEYIKGGDGASEILWGSHGQDGYISLNAAVKAQDDGLPVNYNISLLVDSYSRSIRVASPNNSTGGTKDSGYKIADSYGALFAGTSKGSAGITDLNTFHNASGLFIGDAGSLLDNQNTGLNIVSRTNLRFFVGENTGSANQSMFINKDNGNIGVGTENTTHKLTVAGTISSREIIVEETAGADFVFEENYDLPSLAEIESFIQVNKHLPGIAPASQMIEEGVKVGELQIQLLQKIEELTLHLIDIDKTNQRLVIGNKLLLDRIKQLESNIDE